MLSEFVVSELQKRGIESDDPRVEEKLWGASVTMQVDPLLQSAIAIIDRGGFSSIHYHENKINLFYCISGKARIDVIPDSLSETRQMNFLDPDTKVFFQCGSQYVHQMRALTDCVLMEFYLPKHGQKVDFEDIKRLTTGGRNRA